MPDIKALVACPNEKFKESDMISKMLVACPSCESNGKRQILGEVKDGFFIIMRFHNGFTKIRGEFEVICNLCNEPVYFRTLNRKEVYGTGFSNGSNGFYRSSTMPGTII